MKIRTLIVDDEALARDRLRQLLQEEAEIEIIGECADGCEAVAAIRKASLDLVFLDQIEHFLGGGHRTTSASD